MALTMLPPWAEPDRGTQTAALTTVVHIERARTVVALRGVADLSTRPVLSDILSRVIALQVGDVAIDLAETTFIDRAGVRALATCRELLDRQGRRMTLQSPAQVATPTLRLFGLADLIQAETGP
jgi:anti-anti-sigma factor